MNKLFTLVLLVFIGKTSFAQDTLLMITGRKIVVSKVEVMEDKISYLNMNTKPKSKSAKPEGVFSIIYRDGKEKIIYTPDTLDPMDFKVEEMRNFIKGEVDARRLYRNNYVKVVGLGVGAASGFIGFYGVIGPPIFATVLGAFSPNVEKKLTFKVSGDAADIIGISSGKYLNDVTGKNNSPMIKKGQKLKLGNSCIRFKEDASIDQAISVINEKFNCSRVNASNVDSKIKFFKTESSPISDSSYKEGFSKRVRDYKIRNAMLYGFIGLLGSAIAFSIK